MLFPFVVLLFLNAKGCWKLLSFVLIILQSLAMYIIGTRTSTFGAILIIIISIILVYFSKFEAINRKAHLKFLIILFFMQIIVLPFSPAIRNQLNSNKNNSWVLEDDWIRIDFANQMNGNGLVSGTDEYYFYYLNIIEDYKWLLTIPKKYYYEKYSYYFDPKFYVDLIFNTDLISRQSSRQFQRIFFSNKWDNLSFSQKLFGMGYSRFYTGSILLEQDFLLQYFSYGIIGFILIITPLAYYLFYVFKIFLKSKS